MPTDTKDYNPIRGGISIVAADSPGYLGTLGVVLRDAKDPLNYFLVTALHVLMGGHDDEAGRLKRVAHGGKLLHPIFGANPNNVVARWTVNDVFDQGNFRSPSIRGGVKGQFEDFAAVSCEVGWANDEHVGWITGIGRVVAPVTAHIGDSLVIRGARTGQATWCTVANVNVMVGNTGPFIAVRTAEGMPFRGLPGEPATRGGDSGAVAVRKSDNAMVGLVKGVDRNNPGITLLTPMARIMEACRLTL